MYNARLIAKYVLYKSHQNANFVNNLQLQKLLYFIQAAFLITKGQPCFWNRIEAWSFGPVIPDVYKEYSAYASMSILQADPVFLTPAAETLIDDVLYMFKDYSAPALTNLTCAQTPWIENVGGIISNKSIEKYFKNC